jgi:tricorn protease
VKSDAGFNGRPPEHKPQLRIYDLEKRKETNFLEDAGNYALSTDGKKVLVGGDGAYALYDAAPTGKDSKKAVSTAGLMVDRVPKEEWKNIFDEVWRRYRDFFYVENMHGYDWDELKRQYEPLVGYVAHRSDLNYVIGEMISELSVGHTYIEGGDWTLPARAPVGLLGAELLLDPVSLQYRIAKIFRGQNEEPRYRSPLTEIGVDVHVGDWLLAVDGDALSPGKDPFKSFVNKAANPITLTVAAKDDPKAKRQVKVNPIHDESALLYLDWTERNRDYVAKETGGRVGYMHIPNMGGDGAREFVKWFYPQARMNGMIVDDRANGGGNISQWIIERLRRTALGYRYARTAEDARTYPDVVMRGPMACLISETSASDGDIFPYMFRQSGLGPLIGKRTWGGVIGISGAGPLLDGGRVSVPQFSTLSKEGRYVMEGEGVSPDIEVDNDPASEIAGRDPQLDRAIEEVRKLLAKDPREMPQRPADPVKTKSALK